jgi:hypothetical protein
VQSGYNGQDEAEIREAWLVRRGERTDVFLGRQFVADLGAVKIDGARVDYAASDTLTYLGFLGLYPVRGSRSLDTDYPALRNDDFSAAGRFVTAAGAGVAYRGVTAYGSLGAVTEAPLATKETPRVFVTANGYERFGPQLDAYHFAILDLVGSQGFQLTNLSAGLNYKPSPRLRVTTSLNVVDTETLAVQAGAFFGQPDTGTSVVQNEAFLQRIATVQARGGVSAGLGPAQRFELSANVAARYRPSFTITPPNGTPLSFDQASSVEVYGAFTDRRSVAGLRLGLDASRTFGVSTVSYSRNESLGARVFASHAIGTAGEWEAEVGYAFVQDKGLVNCMDAVSCYGTSRVAIVSAGGTLYYRFNRDWFGLASAYVSTTTSQHVDPGTQTGTPMLVSDPQIEGLTAFLRVAYRF